MTGLKSGAVAGLVLAIMLPPALCYPPAMEDWFLEQVNYQRLGGMIFIVKNYSRTD